MDFQKFSKKRKFEQSKRSKTSLPKTADIDYTLPIFSYKDELIECIQKYQTTIVIGETGSGKSTQLPQFLSEYYENQEKVKGGNEKSCVVCTQPRRVAAVTIAERVANERSCHLGDEVGYSIRFDDRSGPLTKIKYVTDGVLLREIMTDPNLQKYSVVILDEAHERSLQTDILMGLLKQLQQNKPSLRIVVMSATLEAQVFANYFQNSHMVMIHGRQHPVEILYTAKPEPDIIEAAFLTCLQIHEEEEDGGILIFLPGQEDIENVHQLLEQHLPTITPLAMPPPPSGTATIAPRAAATTTSLDESNGTITDATPPSDHGLSYRIHPLYAALSSEEQMLAFQPSVPGVRKIILATNIAETSVTISGIKYVIDPGKVKTRCMHPFTGADMLQVIPVSQSQAQQRSGRAGRECAGKCYRLYTEDVFSALQQSSLPEIQRVGIAQVILQLFAIGIQNPIQFPYISPPNKTALSKGLSQLLHLGALSKERTLTEHGRHMASIPLEPSYAHLLLLSQEFRCVSEALTVVSMLSTDNIYIQPHREEQKKIAGQIHRQFTSRDGDFITLINIYEAWVKSNKSKQWAVRSFINFNALSHAHSIRLQLQQLLQSLRLDTSLACYPEKDPILKCIAKGLNMNIAFLHSSVETKPNSSGSGHSKESRQQTRPLGNGYSPPSHYRTMIGSQDVYIHPSSSLYLAFERSKSKQKSLPKYVIFAEILITTKHYMRYLSVLDENWIDELNIPLRRNQNEVSDKATSSSGR